MSAYSVDKEERKGVSLWADLTLLFSSLIMVFGASVQWGPGAGVFAFGLWMAIVGAVAIIETRMIAAEE